MSRKHSILGRRSSDDFHELLAQAGCSRRSAAEAGIFGILGFAPMIQADASLRESTAVQNLIRYAPSGTYFTRFKVGRKLIRKSLETTVFSVAKQRLPDKIREFRALRESVKAFANGRMTVGDAARSYEVKTDANASLKPRSKDYYKMVLGFIERSWPTLVETDVWKVSDQDCEKWLIDFQKAYAPTVVNNGIAVLRAVFQEAIGAGARSVISCVCRGSHGETADYLVGAAESEFESRAASTELFIDLFDKVDRPKCSARSTRG